MPETIAFSGTVAVAGGPKVAFSEPLAAEAYNRLTVTVAKATAQKIVLGTADSEIRLLLIKSSKYDPVKVTFTLDASPTALKLDMPFLAAGKAAVALLGAAVASVTVKNDLADDITIDVLVVRDPTP
ncbi:MAG: hypothetical protein M3Q69_00730 [Acidobacteriota bacterium]|nr:hypothetical protein [Acidobacteriota bacterium]